jgi:hypothetical protein
METVNKLCLVLKELCRQPRILPSFGAPIVEKPLSSKSKSVKGKDKKVVADASAAAAPSEAAPVMLPEIYETSWVVQSVLARATLFHASFSPGAFSFLPLNG